MVLTETGLAKVFQRIKSFVIAQLNSKASVLHTHTYSEIVDLPNGIAVDSTLDGTSSNAIANSAVKNALDGKISSEIDSMGEGWVRFKSGLQICWGEYDKTTEINKTFNFPKAFKIGIAYPLSVSVGGQSTTLFAGGWSAGYVYIANTNTGAFTYTAVGRWK